MNNTSVHLSGAINTSRAMIHRAINGEVRALDEEYLTVGREQVQVLGYNHLEGVPDVG
ncbi:hypothetical protein [Streptococcus hyointestinalis]|uniref:hypothetical protein n=1 Tax=Streptococcus hyointestinalis TaxID=1337 RepID=UPI0013E013E8|nr:hypothetical protein [Streptococcus hyointestinalis]